MEQPPPMAAPEAPELEQRIRCCSKRGLTDILGRCSRLLGPKLNLSPEREQEARRIFEATVQENVLVNGMLWQEAPEEELVNGSDIKVLEDVLEECIKETATKRKTFPRKICGHVAKTMKSEREKLKFQQAITIPPKTLQPQIEQVSKENELMENASTISQEMNNIMKFLPVLMEKADRLSQSLILLPAMKPSKTHKAVFSIDAERSFQPNNEAEGLSVGKMDVTLTETGKTKTSENHNQKQKRWDIGLIRKYPKRSHHSTSKLSK